MPLMVSSLFKLHLLDSQALRLNTFVAKSLASKLNEATEKTEGMYGMDINITTRMILHLLKFEGSQTGLNLTHTQDRNYIQVHLIFL